MVLGNTSFPHEAERRVCAVTKYFIKLFEMCQV